MTDMAPVYAALQKADAAGDTAGAKQLADYIRAQPADPSTHPFGSGAAGMKDATPYGTVPSNSPQAAAGNSPVAQTDPNSTSPVGDEIGAFLKNAAAGLGKQTYDLIRGAGQYAGLESRQDVADSRQLDAPLNATAGGKAGQIAGGILTTLPALAIPGANTIAGAGLIGAATGALQPSTSTGETVRNIGVGGALGAGGQAVGNAVAAGATKLLKGRAEATADATAVNAGRDAVLAEGRQAGYVVPPTEVNPSATATALESISGKAATKQAAQVVNQKVTNKLVAQDLKLPPDRPITQEALAGVRTQAGQVYNQVKQAGQITTDSKYLGDLASITNVSEDIAKEFPGAATPAADKIDALVKSLSQDSFSAAQALEYTKRLRQQASANFSLAGRTADPEARALASAQSQGANALEEQIGRHLESQGNPDLLAAFQDARTTIAKSYQAQAALKGGNVNAQRLAAQLQKGKKMSDGFGLVARFADHFSDATKLPKGGVGVSKLAATVGGGGALFALGHGNVPLAAASVAASVVPYGVRSGLMSAAGQRVLATPNYAPNALGTLALKGLKQAPNAVLPATAATLPLIQSAQ